MVVVGQAGHLPVASEIFWVGALSAVFRDLFRLCPNAFARSAKRRFVAAVMRERALSIRALTVRASNSWCPHCHMTIGQLLGHKLTSDNNMVVRQCFNYMVWRTYQQNNGVSRQATIKATAAMTGTGTPAMAA